MTRRLRVRWLGDNWHAFGGLAIPDDRVVEVSEEDAAWFLRQRGSARSVEILGWVNDQANEQADPDEKPPSI